MKMRSQEESYWKSSSMLFSGKSFCSRTLHRDGRIQSIRAGHGGKFFIFAKTMSPLSYGQSGTRGISRLFPVFFLSKGRRQLATKTKDRCHSLVFGFILKIHFLFFFVVFGQMSSQIFQKRDDESPVGCAGALDTARPAYVT